MLTLRLCVLSLVLAPFAACGGKTIGPLDDAGTNDGAPQKDVGTGLDVSIPPPDASPPLLDGGTACNVLDPGSHVVSVNQGSGSAPPFAGTGDTIQPGTYELESITIYGSTGTSDSVAGRLAVAVTQNGYLFDVASVSGNESPQRTTSTVEVSDVTTIVITQVCPDQGSPTKALYAAEPTSLTLRIVANGATADESFALLTK
jgi:hypothetical protein